MRKPQTTAATGGSTVLPAPSPSNGVLADLADLRPDEHNRRRHTPRGQGMLVDALHRVGAARSIVIDEDNVILAGNGVVDAAAEAGILKVQVVEADGEALIAVRRRGLTAEQKRDLSISDNRIPDFSEWNPEQLAADREAGMDLQTWFNETEQAKIFNLTDDPTEVWAGLVPMDNPARAFRTITIHCTDQADVDDLAARLNVTIGPKTLFIWHHSMPTP